MSEQNRELVKILAFAGSSRIGSWNKKLVAIAAVAASKVGAEVTVIDLRDYPLPLYDGDLEAASGVPEMVKKLKQLMLNHHGFLIASPEYNSSISGFLKNAIDWTTRPESPDEDSLICYKGKIAAIMSASPGQLGGLRGLVHLRAILGNIGVLVLPGQVAVPQASTAFDDVGNLVEVKRHAAVERLGRRLAETIQKLETTTSLR